MAQPRWWGWHQLDQDWANRLVADTGIGVGDLVVDVGAGHGALTAPLVRAGARVIAVEAHPRRAQLLRDLFNEVVVVQADAADLRLPRRPFHVVANPPFAVTTALLRRLLQQGSRLQTAHLVVPRHVVSRWAGPSAPGAQRWGRTFAISPGRAVPRHAFHPAPPADARVLHVTRR